MLRDAGGAGAVRESGKPGLSAGFPGQVSEPGGPAGRPGRGPAAGCDGGLDAADGSGVNPVMARVPASVYVYLSYMESSVGFGWY